MSRIRVVFSIGSMQGGGAERQLSALLRHLDRTKIEPLLYLVYRSGPLLAEIPDDVSVTAFEERYTGSQRPGFLMHGRRVRDMSRYLQECEADVCYDRTFLMTLIAADAAQRAGVPNVSTVVTDPSRGFAPVAGRHQWVKKRILRRLYNQSTCVLANSAGAARSAERFYGLNAGLVATLYNGVDFDRVQAAASVAVDDEWWNEHVDGETCFRMVSAGRLNQQKGFHLLVDAVSRLQGKFPQVKFRLAILGDGPSRLQLEKQIIDLGLASSVRLTGFRSDAPAWYKSADLFVSASFLEGMPNVLLEAMACVTAVLSSDCPSGPREILQDGKFGELCEVGSVDAIVTGITKFVADDQFAERYVSSGRTHVQQEFSIQTAAAKLEEILLKAAAAKKNTV
jgi:glycosyltransferase involved in cell wall biosynthesis